MSRPPGKPPGSSGPLIDSLPEAQRKVIIDALLAGQSLRSVASQAGISHVQVGEYKRKVILPALLAAQKMNALQQVAQSAVDQTVAVNNLTRAQLQSDPFITRIEQLRSDRERIKQATEDAKDFKAWSSLDRNDLTELELHARLAGRLDQAPTTSITMISLAPTPNTAELPALDVTAEWSE